MLKITVCFIALGCLALASCLPSQPSDNSTATPSWDDNLPPSVFTNEEIDMLIKQVKDSLATYKVKESAVEGLRRMKRGTAQPDNSQWCCNKRDPGQIGPKRQVIKARVVQKTIPAGGRIKCGFLGLSRCSSGATKVVTVTEYYHDYEYPTIPAPEWTNGCPKANIVCCNGYAYYPNLQNCLTFIQLENILTVVTENEDALGKLNNFLQG